MLRRTLFFGSLIALMGYGSLVFMQWQLGLGDFAKGPQHLTFLKFDRKVVAGGRAGVEYLGLVDRQLNFLLHCLENKETVSRPVRVAPGERSQLACGVYLTVLEVKSSDAFAVEVEVSWDK